MNYNPENLSHTTNLTFQIKETARSGIILFNLKFEKKNWKLEKLYTPKAKIDPSKKM